MVTLYVEGGGEPKDPQGKLKDMHIQCYHLVKTHSCPELCTDLSFVLFIG